MFDESSRNKNVSNVYQSNETVKLNALNFEKFLLNYFSNM